jgi:hypothetical protein
VESIWGSVGALGLILLLCSSDSVVLTVVHLVEVLEVVFGVGWAVFRVLMMGVEAGCSFYRAVGADSFWVVYFLVRKVDEVKVLFHLRRPCRSIFYLLKYVSLNQRRSRGSYLYHICC